MRFPESVSVVSNESLKVWASLARVSWRVMTHRHVCSVEPISKESNTRQWLAVYPNSRSWQSTTAYNSNDACPPFFIHTDNSHDTQWFLFVFISTCFQKLLQLCVSPSFNRWTGMNWGFDSDRDMATLDLRTALRGFLEGAPRGFWGALNRSYINYITTF